MNIYYIAITLLVLFTAFSQEFVLTSKFAWTILCLYLFFKLVVSGFKLSSINPNHEGDFKYSPPEEWEKDEPWLSENHAPTDCWCHNCNKQKIRTIMIVCPKCGNKRCPHASDHNNICSNSNKTNQEGSIFNEKPKN